MKKIIERFMNIFRIQPKDIKLLLKQVKTPEFVELLTGAELIKNNKKIMFKVGLGEVKRLGLNDVISNLLYLNIAIPVFEHNETILEYIMIYSDYEQIMDNKISLFSDFKQLNQLLGENDKLSNFVELVNRHSKLELDKTTQEMRMVIPLDHIRENELVLDFMVLNSIGLVNYNDDIIEIKPEFCSWLIEYRNRQNYKITFLDIYSETI